MKAVAFTPAAPALIAAVLFGVSTPLAKVLLGEVDPVVLAALLYLGCGAGVAVFKLSGHLAGTVGRGGSAEARLRGRDLPWLAAAVAAGGVAAPIVLLVGLLHTPAATASLLLNFEGVATALIAAAAFREALGRRVWAAVALVTAASVLLSWEFNGRWGVSWGALGILAACALWGADNNFTRHIAAKDPLVIVTVKGFVAGAVSLALALALGKPFPAWTAVAGAMLLGAFSYGLSLVFFVLALRGLGAARTGGLYGIAPFAGAAMSFVIFRESPHGLFWVSLPVMAAGAYLLLKEVHAHPHTHEAMEHEHGHRHDDGHHEHDHHPADPPLVDSWHSHPHRHEEFAHAHPHTPDLHHRHRH